MNNQHALNQLAALKKHNAPFLSLPAEQQRQLEVTRCRLDSIQKELSDLVLVLSSQSDLSVFVAEYLNKLPEDLKNDPEHQLAVNIMLGLFAALYTGSSLAERIDSDIFEIAQQLPDFRSQRMATPAVDAEGGAV